MVKACAGPFEKIYPYGDEYKENVCYDDRNTRPTSRLPAP